nr:MAG TPA: hypothetical protein [Caudoviricetes sp.]
MLPASYRQVIFKPKKSASIGIFTCDRDVTRSLQQVT